MRKETLSILALACLLPAFTVSISDRAIGYVPLSNSPSWSTQGDLSSTDVALGDFDYDGDLDLASFSENNVLVYRNDGGNLGTSPAWTSQEGTSGTTGDVIWADIDNDHYPELFSDLGMYENNNGVLATTAMMTNLSRAAVFTLGDVDRDGYADLITGKNDLIEVYKNVGGVIDDHPDWNTTEANSPGALGLGDSDNDGYQELAVGNKWDPIRLYDNVGGSLRNVSMWNSTLTDYVGCLAWGDIARDHFPELYACTQPFSGGEPNRIYANVAGTLEPYPSWNSTETSYATDAEFADMNGDGYLDLVVSNLPYFSMSGLSLGQEMVYLNENGVMNRTKGWSGPYQDVSYGLDVGLVNGDAYPDVVVASSSDILQSYSGRILVYSGLPPNRSPVIDTVSSPASVRVGDTLTVTVTAQDPDGDSMQYEFSVAAGNGTIVSESGPSAVWRAPDTPGAYTINITVGDGKGGFAYYDHQVSAVPNRAPVITDVSASPSQPGTGEKATIVVTASDFEGDTLQYNFTVSAENGEVLSQSGASAVWRAPGTAGNYTVNITVSDGRGGFAYRDYNITVVKSPPRDSFFSFGNVWFLLMLAIIVIAIVIAATVAVVRKRAKSKGGVPPAAPPEQPGGK